MTFNEEELKRLHEEYGGDTTAVAAHLGLSPTEGRPLTRRRKVRPPSDLGKESMRKWIVTARHAEHSTWPTEDQDKIEDARSKYEAGTHEMCQGRDRDWFILYLIPRKTRTGARKFFNVSEFS